MVCFAAELVMLAGDSKELGREDSVTGRNHILPITDAARHSLNPRFVRTAGTAYSVTPGYAACRAFSLACIVFLLLAFACRRTLAQSTSLAAAGAAEDKGSYEEAIEGYRAILKQFPSSREAKLGLGRNLAKVGDCAKAEAVLKSVKGPSARGSGPEDWLGLCYLRTGEPEKAIAELQRALQPKPHDKELSIELARTYAGAGHPQQAIDTLKAWLSSNGNDPDVLYWLGKIEDEASEDTFQRMRKADANNYLVLQIMGEEYAKRLELAKAVETYKKALALRPDRPALHCGLGDVYWRMRKLDDAKQELEKGLKLSPYNAVANYELGDVYFRQGDAAKAIPYLERALQIDPTLSDAHRTLGNAFSLQQDYVRALREFQVLARQSPDDSAVHALLAKTYRRMGRFKEANEENAIFERLEKSRAESDKKSASERLELMQHPVNNPPSPPPNH